MTDQGDIRVEIDLQAGSVGDMLTDLRRTLGRDGLLAAYEEIARRVARIMTVSYPNAGLIGARAPMADLWTDKQRRWFFAAVARGEVRLPYWRRGHLARGIQADLRVAGRDAILTLTVPRRGKFDPRWVIGRRDQQSRYFRRTRWQPFWDQVRERRAEIEEITRVVVLTVVEDLGNG